MFVQFTEEIKSSYTKLINTPVSVASTSHPWVLYSLATKTNALVVSEEGSGIDSLLEEFEASKIQFGFACHPIHNLSKFLLICWCGEGVPVSGKSQFHSIVKDVTSFFQNTHVVIQARTETDLDYKAILKKLEDSAGAKYNESKNTSAPVNRPPPPMKPVTAPLATIPATQNTVHRVGNEPLRKPEPVSYHHESEPISVQSTWKPTQTVPTPVVSSSVSSTPAPQAGSNRSVEKLASQFNQKANINSPSTQPAAHSVSSIAAKFHQSPASSIDRVQQERERRLKEDAEARERAHAEEQSRLSKLKGPTSTTSPAISEPPRFQPQNHSNTAHVNIPSPSEVIESQKRQADLERREREEQQQQLQLLEQQRRQREQEEQELVRQRRAQEAQEAVERKQRQEEEEAAERHRLLQKQKEEEEEEQRRRKLLEEEEQARQKQKQQESSSGITAVALYDYVPAEPNEIPMNEHETITNILQLDEGWWQGTNSSVPANYVEIIVSNTSSAPAQQVDVPDPVAHVQQPAPPQPASRGPVAIVLYDYDASEENELTLRAGDVVTDIEMIAEEWWQGRHAGLIGLFPANYVELQSS